jgi:hypothetical protein
MKIFAFDNEGSCGGGGWKKCWASLGYVEVHKCSTTKSRTSAVDSIKTTCKTGTALLLVHQGECESNVHDEVTLLLENCPSLFVMYVSGGSGGAQPKQDHNNSSHVHYSRTTVGSGVDLAHLKNRFDLLSNKLKCAKGEEDVKKAWHEFDRNAYPETLTAAYLLMVARANDIDVPLNSLSDGQWEMACKQYKDIGGDRLEDWSDYLTWNKDNIGEIKKGIGVLLSRVASQTR